MSSFSSYLTDIMKKASEISKQRNINLEKYASIKRASSIAEAGYFGGYKKTSEIPNQKFTSKELSQLKTLQQQAKITQPTLSSNLIPSIKDISIAETNFLKNITKNKPSIEQITAINNLLFKNQLFEKAASVKLANKTTGWLTDQQGRRYWGTEISSINEDQFKELLKNPLTSKKENLFTTEELKLLNEINKSTEMRNSLLREYGSKNKKLLAITQKNIKETIPTIISQISNAENFKNLNFIIATEDKKHNISYEIDPVAVEKEKYKTNFLQNLKVKEKDTEDSFLKKINLLKKQEENFLKENVKNPALSFLDLSGYKSLIADAKAQEYSMNENLNEYINTGKVSKDTVVFNENKKGYLDSAKNFGQLMYTAYSSAYDELQKAFQSAKTNWDTFVKTKATTLSGINSILSTLDKSTTSVSGAQHSLGDLDAQQARLALLNKQLNRTTSFSGTKKPIATFISRPS